MPKLPPLNALRAFEAAARHEGFIAASEELHVTRGAISRHVKLLEDHLGLRLFTRQAQGVRLTPAGKRLQPVLAEAFAMIASEVQALAADASELRILCPPGTSIRWLIPKLDQFREAHPDISVRLTTDFHSDGGFAPQDADIAFSVTHWPNRAQSVQILPLFPITMVPACSPDYLRTHPMPDASALGSCELLHESKMREDWRDWAECYPQAGIDPTTGQQFPNLDMATKAAVMGVGLVMADLVLCRDELASGALVAPFPDLISTSPRGDICLIAEQEVWHRPSVAAFREWAEDAARADRETVRDQLTAAAR